MPEQVFHVNGELGSDAPQVTAMALMKPKIAGADLGSIMDEFKKDPLMSKENPDAHTAGDMTPPKYVVVNTIDDFQDVAQKLDQGGEGDMRARVIRINVVTNIYKINSGEVYESISTPVTVRKPVGDNPNVHQTGDTLDELLLTETKEAANKASQRVVDVFFPAKIVSKTDKNVMINRGDGTSIAKGQIWDAFAQGEEIKDPDTGEVLGKQEVHSGKIRIIDVQPRFSTGEVIEDTGIDKGNVVRLHDDTTKTK